MNFSLLWLEMLLIGLLWVAAWGAWIGRVRNLFIRITLWLITQLIPAVALGVLVAGAAVMKYRLGLERNWFYYFLSLVAVYAIGAGVLTTMGLRRQGGTRSVAAMWPRGGLILAWLIAVAMGYITLGNMDLAARSNTALLGVKANSVYLATLPAIVSENQNAAPIYEEAIARLKADPPTDILNPPFGDRDDFDPNEPATIAYLKRQSPTIGLLRKAAAMPACRFDWEVLDPDVNRALGLNDMRSAANLLNLDAQEAIARGTVGEAVADTAAMYGMGRHVGNSMLVTALVGLGIDAMGNSTLQHVLPHVTRPEELAPLNLDALPPLGSTLRQAMRGEERFGLLLYAQIPNMLNAGFANNAPRDQAGAAVQAVKVTAMQIPSGTVGEMFLRVFYLDPNAYVELMSQAQSWATRPYYQIRDALPAVWPGRFRGLMTSLIAPPLGRFFETTARVEAMDACARVAVAMTRYRLDHGTLPSNLEALTPRYMEAIPADPFDGKPLRLSVKKGQWIIYSVGPDGVDDGGVELNRKTDKGDVIFTLKDGK